MGKPLESWNFVISFSRPGELWIFNYGSWEAIEKQERMMLEIMFMEKYR